MDAKLIKRLADAADVAKLELAPGALTLAPLDDDRMIAWFGGMYSGCAIVIQCERQELQDPISVAPLDFQQMVDATFDDGMEVQFIPATGAVTLATRQRKVSLNYMNRPDLGGYQKLASFTPIASISYEALLREVQHASEVAADNAANPVLTAIRLVVAGSQAGVQAANGVSLVLETRLAGKATERLEVIAPTDDLLLALKILKGDTVHLGKSGNALVLQSEDALVKIATISGSWPKMDALKRLVYEESLVLPVASIKAMTAAAKIYKAEGDVFIRPAEGGITLETAPSEKGQFREEIPTDQPVTKVYVMNLAALDVASKICEEPNLAMSISPNMALISVGERKLYMTLRAV